MEAEDVDGPTGPRKSPRFAVRKCSARKQNSIVQSSTNESEESRPSKKRKRNGKETLRSHPKKSQKKKQVGYKCCPQMLYDLIQELDGDQKEWVEELGFGALLLMKEVRIPKALTLWLIDQVDWKRKCLCIRGRRFYLKDWISGALDLPNGELKVPLPKAGRGKLKIRNPTEQEKEYRAADGGRGMKVKDTIKALLAEKDMVKFKKQFMLVLLCIYLAPTSGHFINRSYLSALVNIDQVKDMDWCEFVVNYLVDGIREYLESTAANVNVHGCVHLLCLMYIDIVKSQQIKVPTGITRVQCVTTELMDLLESLDIKIDRNNVPSFGNLEINPEIVSQETDSDEDEPASRVANSSRTCIPEELPKPKRKMKQSGLNVVNSSRHKKQKVVTNDKPLPKSLDEIEEDYNIKRNKIYQNFYEKLSARLQKLDKRRRDATEAFMKNQLEEQKVRITCAVSSGTSHSEDVEKRDSDTNIDNGLLGTSQGSGRSQSGNGDVDGQSNVILPILLSPVEGAKDGVLQKETVVESEINNMIVDGRTDTSNSVSERPTCQVTNNIDQCSGSTADCVLTKEDNLSVQEKPATPVEMV